MGIGLLSPFRYPLTPHPSAASPPCSCLGSFPPLLFFHGRIPFSMLRRKHCMIFAISSHLHEALLLIRHCDALLFFHARRAGFSDPRALSEGAAYKKLALLPGSRQFLLYPFVCGRWKKSCILQDNLRKRSDFPDLIFHMQAFRQRFLRRIVPTHIDACRVCRAYIAGRTIPRHDYILGRQASQLLQRDI